MNIDFLCHLAGSVEMAARTGENERFEAVSLVFLSVCLPAVFSTLFPDLHCCELRTEPFFHVFLSSSEEDGLHKAF